MNITFDQVHAANNDNRIKRLIVYTVQVAWELYARHDGKYNDGDRDETDVLEKCRIPETRHRDDRRKNCSRSIKKKKQQCRIPRSCLAWFVFRVDHMPIPIIYALDEYDHTYLPRYIYACVHGRRPHISDRRDITPSPRTTKDDHGEGLPELCARSIRGI